jgi:hypothetical protein
VNCGKQVPEHGYYCPRTEKAGLQAMRRASRPPVRFGHEAWVWFATTFDLDPTDEHLPEIAMQLAKEGRLTVYVEFGKVVGVAEPREAQP